MTWKTVTLIFSFVCIVSSNLYLVSMDQCTGNADKQTILVIGGAGFIGSHAAYAFAQRDNKVIVLDNLWYGHEFKHPWATFIQGDYGDKTLLETIFSNNKVDAVIHFASFTKVSESTTNPAMYYDNNLVKTITLLDSMVKYNVKKIVFSSSALVYGATQTPLISETHPCNPTSPYGNTKLAIEHVLRDYEQAYGIAYVALRYFNVAGALPEENLGDYYPSPWHLVSMLARTIINGNPFIIFNGHKTEDGTNLRDYVHVLDVADANTKALDYLNAGNTSNTFNIASGKGTSVQEFVTITEKITGKKIAATFKKHPEGFPDTMIGDIHKAQTILHWQPKHSSPEEIMRSSYEFELYKQGQE